MQPPTASSDPAAVRLRTLFLVWLSIGAQSFGGGQATLSLIRQAVVERRGWVSEEEFARDQTLCRPVPGMNLLALTILIGSRLAGPWGVIISLLGLLLPSVSLTLFITVLLRHTQQNPEVREALRDGVIPATVGMGLYTTFQTGRTLLRMSLAESKRAFAFGLLVIASCVAAAVLYRIPIFLLLCAAGLTGAVFSRLPGNKRASADDATGNGT
jgi:chromate transporter